MCALMLILLAQGEEGGIADAAFMTPGGVVHLLVMLPPALGWKTFSTQGAGEGSGSGVEVLKTT
eukprot:m.447831 g.447831  ORF g.447831 m.447831 type:complete len:64 (-) comp56882_c0_seq4:1939-2130(-)